MQPYYYEIAETNMIKKILTNTRYDIILDATDNVATRYLLNDACVLAGKPLVSGSALRFEGQVCVVESAFLHFFFNTSK